MANSLTTNPIIIDTTTDAAVTNMRNIQSIVWASNSDHEIGANAELKMTDTAGNVIVQYLQVTAKEGTQFLFPFGHWANGIKVTTLGSGEVFIFLTKRR